MVKGKGYDEYEAKIRVPKGTRLDRSLNTPGARRGLARDRKGNLVGQAEIFDMKKVRPGRSTAPEAREDRAAPVRESRGASEAAPDISQLVPLALVAVGLAAGAAGVAAVRSKRRRGRTDTPAGWYALADDPDRLRYWDGGAWTDDYAQLASASPRLVADWYPDPAGESELRYWDGTAWTGHLWPAPAPSTPADWYPDPCDAAQLRYWDGSDWTAHVTTANVPHPGTGFAPTQEEPRIDMSRAEWQAHVLAWLQAGAIQHELWQRLSHARIHDADDATLAAQQKMEELTPREGASRILLMLEANPSLREPGALVDFMKQFGREPDARMGIEPKNNRRG